MAFVYNNKGREINVKLCKILDVDPDVITHIILDFPVDGVITATITRHVLGSQVDEVLDLVGKHEN